VRLTTILSAALIALCLPAPALLAQPGSGLAAEAHSLPTALEVPEGHTLYLKTFAAGTQNYVCLPSGDGAAWRFLGPQATVFLRLGAHTLQQVATHYLSLNPVEQATARPTWQHSFDSSQVWGRVAASSTDPDVVAPGAIPWLLVEVVGRQRGPAGGSLLTPTTYIQRINTSGGVAPETGCTTGDVGRLALVPYTTDYLFYRAARVK
jgi:hypothetical protein